MFTVPVGEWFKTNLKDYIIEIIDSDLLKNRGIFNHEYLNSMLKDHIEGKIDYTRELRAIVNLELWFRSFTDEYIGEKK
jgi:asparagine synthase (glutamine-hydrolysing)